MDEYDLFFAYCLGEEGAEKGGKREGKKARRKEGREERRKEGKKEGKKRRSKEGTKRGDTPPFFELSFFTTRLEVFSILVYILSFITFVLMSTSTQLPYLGLFLVVLSRYFALSCLLKFPFPLGTVVKSGSLYVRSV